MVLPYAGNPLFRNGETDMISVVIPMYNEQSDISGTAARLGAHLRSAGREYELVLVNDGSSDGTAQVLSALAADPHVRVVSYEENRGKGYAMRQGAAAARGDLLVFLDADLSYGLPILDEAIEMFRTAGADLVVGSRVLAEHATEKYPPARKLASGAFRFLVHCITRLPFTDTQCGFKCYTRAAADKIFPRCTIDRFAADIEILTVAKEEGLRVCEIPAAIQTHGASSVNLLPDSIAMLRDAMAISRAHRKKKRG